jgi:hypothetical protein
MATPSLSSDAKTRPRPDTEYMHPLSSVARFYRAPPRVRVMSSLRLGISMRILRRRELVEAVLQDVFVKIWNNAGRFDSLTAA